MAIRIVLVIEDSRTERSGMGQVLQAAGFIVIGQTQQQRRAVGPN